jgi:hypothetical protein
LSTLIGFLITQFQFGPDHFTHSGGYQLTQTGGVYIKLQEFITFSCIKPGAGTSCVINVLEKMCNGPSCMMLGGNSTVATKVAPSDNKFETVIATPIN